MRLDRKGRGLALRHIWSSSEADIVAYMDADLSAGLDAFLPLIAPLLSGHSDLSVGSRLAHGAQVVRGPERESFHASITCCCVPFFRPVLRRAVRVKGRPHRSHRALLPAVADDAWFFDTELLMLAQRKGLVSFKFP